MQGTAIEFSPVVPVKAYMDLCSEPSAQVVDPFKDRPIVCCRRRELDNRSSAALLDSYRDLLFVEVLLIVQSHLVSLSRQHRQGSMRQPILSTPRQAVCWANFGGAEVAKSTEVNNSQQLSTQYNNLRQSTTLYDNLQQVSATNHAESPAHSSKEPVVEHKGLSDSFPFF